MYIGDVCLSTYLYVIFISNFPHHAPCSLIFLYFVVMITDDLDLLMVIPLVVVIGLDS